jgi:hypothetical protein
MPTFIRGPEDRRKDSGGYCALVPVPQDTEGKIPGEQVRPDKKVVHHGGMTGIVQKL